MQKTKVDININDFPQELHYIFADTNVYDSSSSPKAQVLYSDLGYYIKIADAGNLSQEATLARLFDQKGLGPRVVFYIQAEKDYLVTESAKGEDALEYLDNPKKLCEVLADAMKYLHDQSIEGVPVSTSMKVYDSSEKGMKLKKDTFIHGDFCLPNVMLENWKFTSFIDAGAAGVGDKHIDIYWTLWSLQYNLKTDEYTDYFLDCYGREKVDMDILKIVAEVET